MEQVWAYKEPRWMKLADSKIMHQAVITFCIGGTLAALAMVAVLGV